jgi:serine/threonine-protein kinase
MPRDDKLDDTHRGDRRPGDTTERPLVAKRKDPLLGTRLGDYKVLDALGEGAMGIVYRGVHPVLGRPVAIKVMREKFAADPTHAKRLLDEARAVAAIRHPNVIDVFGFGKTPFGQPYFVMELLDGDALDAYLNHAAGCRSKKRSSCSPRRRRRWRRHTRRA